MLDREMEQGVGAGKGQLLADMFAVMFDRARAEAQGIRNLAAGLIVRDQLQDVMFGGGELFHCRFLLAQLGGAAMMAHQIRGEHRADIFLSGGHLLDALNDFGQDTGLENIAADALVERRIKAVFIGEMRPENGFHWQAFSLYFLNDSKAITARHFYIQNRYGWTQGANQFQCLRASIGFSDDFPGNIRGDDLL